MAIDSATTAAAAVAPWWGTPVISGISLLLGALLTQGTNILSSSHSRIRENLRRHEELAREVSLRVLTEATKLFDYRSRENRTGVDSDLLLAWTELPLVASQGVYDTGDALVQKVVAYSILPEEEGQRSALTTAIREYHQARQLYVSAIRKESGLSAINDPA